MPTPRQSAQQKGSTLKSPGSYCGVCGLPGSSCDCKKYKEWGATRSGSGGVSGAGMKMDMSALGKKAPFVGKEE